MAAAAPVAGVATHGDVAAASSDGYGLGGYGQGGYGDSGFSVATAMPTDVGTTSATLNGELTNLDGASSADCSFEWHQIGVDTWTTTTVQTLSSTGSYSQSLTGLEDGVEYEYGAIGDASDGDTNSGDIVPLTTGDDLPVVTTGSASDVTDSSATLNGTLDDLGGADSVDYYFEWRPVGADTWNATPTQTLNATGSVSESVTGLEEETDYEYRAVAAASDGDTTTGTTASWITTDNASAVSTGSASDVTDTSATLNGTLDDLGGAASADCYFEWRAAGTDTWSTTAVQTLSSTGSYSQSLTGLEDGAEYEYRAVAVASDGDASTGTTASWITTENGPGVSTGTAPTVTDTTATLNGTLDDLGGAASADCSFEWRQTGADTWNATATQTLTATGSYSSDVDGLAGGTEYEYRAVATASDGDAATGAAVTFTTTSADTAPGIDSHAVTEAGSPNPHAEITDDWTVSDADADLATVDVEVVDASGTVVDAARTAIGGSDASGTDSFKVKHVDGQTFDVSMTVTDAAGNTASGVQTVTE